MNRITKKKQNFVHVSLQNEFPLQNEWKYAVGKWWSYIGRRFPILILQLTVITHYPPPTMLTLSPGDRNWNRSFHDNFFIFSHQLIR